MSVAVIYEHVSSYSQSVLVALCGTVTYTILMIHIAPVS